MPATVKADPATLRPMVNAIRPALHDVSDKTWANLRSLFVAALELAGVIDSMGRGDAVADAAWGPLMASIKHDKRMFCGLAAFANWCVGRGIRPDAVDDATVAAFLAWLETRTLSPKPRDVARRVPNIWNEARAKVARLAAGHVEHRVLPGAAEANTVERPSRELPRRRGRLSLDARQSRPVRRSAGHADGGRWHRVRSGSSASSCTRPRRC